MSPTSAPSFRRALAKQEKEAGRWLEEEATRGWAPWEVTLSQTLWRGLADDPATAGRIRTTVYSQAEEGENGADWLWSFSTRGSKELLPLLVQAKRLRDGKYAINQMAGTITQVERLKKHAASKGIPAAYLFFNPQSQATTVARSCSALPRNLLGGVTLADATLVAAIAKASGGVVRPEKLYGSLHLAEHAWPLSCALCCGEFHTWPGGGFASAIGESLRASGIRGTTRVGEDSEFKRELSDFLASAPDRAALARAHESNSQPYREREQTFLAEHGLGGIVAVEADFDEVSVDEFN